MKDVDRHTKHGRRRYAMNQDIVKGKWKQMRGQVKEWWGKLTDDDLDRIDGTMDKLAARCRSATASSATRPSGRSRSASKATRPSRASRLGGKSRTQRERAAPRTPGAARPRSCVTDAKVSWT